MDGSAAITIANDVSIIGTCATVAMYPVTIGGSGSVVCGNPFPPFPDAFPDAFPDCVAETCHAQTRLGMVSIGLIVNGSILTTECFDMHASQYSCFLTLEMKQNDKLQIQIRREGGGCSFFGTSLRIEKI